MKTPFVSVVIPTYNRAKWIGFAIDSVLAQTYSDYEIVVVDDGSNDNTEEILRQYDGQIRYFYQHNAGVSAARNFGIENSQGEWIAFLDSDDEWLPDKLQMQVDLLKMNSDLVAVASDVWIEDGVNTVRFFHIRKKTLSKVFRRGETGTVLADPLIQACEINFFPSSLMVKKSSLKYCGLFDTQLSLSEDRDFVCRLTKIGSFGLLNTPLARIVTRGLGDISLSSSQEKDSRKGLQAGLVTYTKLLNLNNLTNSEVLFIKKRLSATRFYYGLEEIKIGNPQTGYSYIWQSLRDRCSLVSLMRILIFFVFGWQTVEQIQRVKQGKKYFRSNFTIEK